MKLNRTIDHIVYAAPNLEEAISDLESRLGIRPSTGGRHLNKGTKNALLNLGNGCYLEILAIDEENKNIPAPRWMGVDYISSPKVTRWCLKSDNLEHDSKTISSVDPTKGIIGGGSRKTTSDQLLFWEMILPTSKPEVDLIPFMTDWLSSDVHPADSLADVCHLVGIELYHPNPQIIQSLIDDLDCNIVIQKDSNPTIKVSIKCPKGIVTL